MSTGVPEVDEERTVHSFGVWGVGLEIDSLVLLTQRVLKERLYFCSTYSLGGSFVYAFS